jgi:hypothetical protein
MMDALPLCLRGISSSTFIIIELSVLQLVRHTLAAQLGLVTRFMQVGLAF